MKTLRIFTLLMLTLSAVALLAQDPVKADKGNKVKTERPFIIHDRSNKVNRVDIRKDSKGADNIIQIDATSASGGAGLISKASLAPAIITNISIIGGSYNQTRELSKSSRGTSMQLLDVAFPCRVRINLSDQHVDIEFKEAGFWKVSLGLLN